MSQKIVVNACYGGFGLSAAATEALAKRKGIERLWWFKIGYIPTATPDSEFVAMAYSTPDHQDDSYFDESRTPRNDADLIAVVEAMGSAASGKHADLKVVEVPDGVEFEIEEYDGHEWVAEKHRTWYPA